MLTRKTICLSFTLLLSAAPFSAHAQFAPDIEASFVELVKGTFPDFRIVKKMEDFPERYNASVKLPIRAESSTGSDNEKALVTLHDGNTGAPMESCFTPCTLHKLPGHPTFVFGYKVGHFTFPSEIEADPAQMRALYPFWDDVYRVSLGPDYNKAQVERRLCMRAFQLMERTDQDAKPCYRIPPPMPEINYSGKCEIHFDVSPRGLVVNARAADCTDEIFEGPSLFAVSHWTYFPKVDRGMAVTRKDVRTTLKFDVTDYDGTLLDETGKRVEK